MRYGRRKSTYIIEKYLGKIDESGEFRFEHLVDIENSKKVAPGESISLENLILMIHQDGEMNKNKSAQQLLWWVDVVSESESATAANMLIYKFGVPRNFEDDVILHDSTKLQQATISFGESITSATDKPSIHSINTELRTFRLSNIPVVPLDPDWMKAWQGSMYNYFRAIYLRVAPFLSFSNARDRDGAAFHRSYTAELLVVWIPPTLHYPLQHPPTLLPSQSRVSCSYPCYLDRGSAKAAGVSMTTSPKKSPSWTFCSIRMTSSAGASLSLRAVCSPCMC
jgi:hypothetical protein